MSEMVERVARAIEGKVKCPVPSELYLSAARAAIEAMREPTLKMLDINQGNWRAAIDEALKGTKTVDWNQTIVVLGEPLK